MATNKLSFPSFHSWIGYVEEATFGTAIADAQPFTILDMIGNDAPLFSPQQFIDDNIRNRGKNVADINDYFKTESGMWQTYTLPECIGRSGDLANMLYAACETVSEAVGTPFVKTYTLDGTVNPDFSSNAGYFATVLIKEPFSSFSKKLTSSILRTLTINVSLDQGGRLTFSGELVTGKGYTGTSDPSSETNGHSSTSPIHRHSTGTGLTISGTDMVWYSAQFVITNVLDFVGHSVGKAENYAIVSQAVTGNIVVKYDANTDAFANGKGTSLGVVALTLSANTASDYFKFTCNDSWLKEVASDRGGTDTVQKLNLNFDFLNDYANSQYCVFECADGVDRTW
ncbi:MAG TPA: hypothetical protein VIH28_09610 [Ignavibacteriaceae bacterium]